MINFYHVLQISETASQAEIEMAYEALKIKWHPDKNPTNQAEATRKFKEVSNAYEILGDPAKRHKYDAELRTSRRHFRGFKLPGFELDESIQELNESMESSRKFFDEFGRKFQEGMNMKDNKEKTFNNNFTRTYTKTSKVTTMSDGTKVEEIVESGSFVPQGSQTPKTSDGDGTSNKPGWLYKFIRGVQDFFSQMKCTKPSKK